MTCMGAAPRPAATSTNVRRLEWSEPAEWKEWNVGDSVVNKIRYERIIGSMCQVVLILHADDWCDFTRSSDLHGCDVAKADMTH